MAPTSRSLTQALFASLSLALTAAGGTGGSGAGGAASAGAARATARAGHAARFVKPSGTISWMADKVDYDNRAQKTVLRGNVIVSQGDLRATADRAERQGLSGDDSRWTFTGHVHVSSALQGNLDSDEATINVRGNEMQDAVVTGAPANFEQTSSTTGVLACGHSDSIVYTVAAGTVRLTDDAWLKYGDNEITAPWLVYNLKTEQLQGASATDRGQRVHITILPKNGGAGAVCSRKSEPQRGGSPSSVEPGKQP
jgi:lipopolysaccharide transport protein LptA